MKQIVIISFLVILTLQSNCNVFWNKEAIFSLENMSSKNSYEHQVNPFTTVQYNFCNFASDQCGDQNAFVIKSFNFEAYEKKMEAQLAAKSKDGEGKQAQSKKQDGENQDKSDKKEQNKNDEKIDEKKVQSDQKQLEENKETKEQKETEQTKGETQVSEQKEGDEGKQEDKNETTESIVDDQQSTQTNVDDQQLKVFQDKIDEAKKQKAEQEAKQSQEKKEEVKEIKEQKRVLKTIDPTDGMVCTRYTSNSHFYKLKTKAIDNDPQKGLSIIYFEGESYNKDQNINHRAVIHIKCDKSVDKWVQDEFKEELNVIEITGRSQYGCPKLQISKVYIVLASYKYILAAALLALGIYFAFYGLKFISLTLFFTGFCLSMFIICIIYAEFLMGEQTSAFVVYLSLICTCVFSALIGCICSHLYKVGMVTVGIWCGVLVGILFNTLLLTGFQKYYTIWVSVIFMAIVFGTLTFYYYKEVLLVSTGFFGSYMISKAAGVIFGGFPNEFTIMNQLKYGHITNFHDSFIIYIISIVVIAGIGITYQRKYFYEDLEQRAEQDISLKGVSPIYIKEQFMKIINKRKQNNKNDVSDTQLNYSNLVEKDEEKKSAYEIK